MHVRDGSADLSAARSMLGAVLDAAKEAGAALTLGSGGGAALRVTIVFAQAEQAKPLVALLAAMAQEPALNDTARALMEKLSVRQDKGTVRLELMLTAAELSALL